MIRYSERLPWAAQQNRLARQEAAHRDAGRALLDLTITNPTQVGIAYPAAGLAAAWGDDRGAAYEPSPLGMEIARQAVAADYLRRGIAIDPAQIAITSSSSESYALLFKLFADPDGAVLIPEPSYPLFDHLARLEGITPRPYRLQYDGRWHIDFSSIDCEGARALCAVSPNNPTGSFIASDDLDRLADLVNRAGIPLVVDEVFSDYPLHPPKDAVRVAAAHPSAALTFSLGGLSKGCGLPQLKLGWIAATGPDPLVHEAMARLALVADTYLSVSTPVQRALPRLLSPGIGGAIRTAIQARIEENQRALETAIAGSPCSGLPIEAGWSAVLRVPAVMDDETWALALLEEDDVLVAPGYFFDLDVGTNLVVSLIAPPEVFREGVERIVRRSRADGEAAR